VPQSFGRPRGAMTLLPLQSLVSLRSSHDVGGVAGIGGGGGRRHARSL